MMLKNVKLNSFVSHKESELNLDYGINVITGSNGAGKTSIVDAISFGLFNVHSRGKKKNLINSRANKAKLTVGFSEGGINYAVEWSVERSKAAHGTLFRMQNGERTLIAKGGERVIVSEVEKILGIDKNLFLQSIYVRQGEIENLVTATPAVRKELISKLLGLEDLQRAWGRIKDVINEYEITKAELTAELRRIPKIESEIQEDETKTKELEVSLESERNELGEVGARIGKLQEALKKLKDSEEKFGELDHRKKLVENEIENVEIRLEEKEDALNKAFEAHMKVEALKDAVKKLPLLENYARALTNKERKESEKKYLEEKTARIDQTNKILQDNKEGFDSYIEKRSLSREKRDKRRNYEGAEDALIRIRKQLKNNERDEARKNQDLTKELETCSEVLGEQITIDNLESVLSKRRIEFQSIKSTFEKKADQCNQQLGSLKERITNLEYKIGQISDAEVCPLCGTELTPDHVEKLDAEFAAEKKRVGGETAVLKEEQRKANQEKKNAQAKLDKTASIDPVKIKDLANQVAEIRERIAQEKLDEEDLQEKAETLKKLDEEIKSLDDEVEKLGEAYQTYESAKREIARHPSKGTIEAELKPIKVELNKISLMLGKLEKDLGYKPENPEEELQELRNKKEEYDRNAPTAKNKTKLESEVARIRQKLSDKRSEQNTIIEEITELAYDEGMHKRKEEEQGTEEKRKSEIEKTIVEIRTTMKNLNDETSKLTKELKQLLRKETEKKKVKDFVRILNKIREAFSKDGIQRLIRARARPMLEKITRDFFEKFNLEYSDIKIDDDYHITVIGPTGSQTINQISGGERVALAIALRLAIARVLSGKVETVIMDEPTTYLDEERRKELVNILNSFFREGGRIIPQMLIITHHREIEDVADVIYNVNKKEGYSIVEAMNDQ